MYMYDWRFSDPVSTTWVLLRQTWEALAEYLWVELSIYDLTLAQIDILRILSISREPLPECDIASLTFRTPQSVSGLISRMQKAGYVRKSRSGANQRSVTVKLQPKGQEVVDKVMELGFEYGNRVIKSALSTDEIEQLGTLLTKCRNKALEGLGYSVQPLPEALDAEELVRRQRRTASFKR